MTRHVYHDHLTVMINNSMIIFFMIIFFMIIFSMIIFSGSAKYLPVGN